MDFNEIVNEHTVDKICWFNISTLFSKLSKDIRYKNDPEKVLLEIFDVLFLICTTYNLDMNKAWEKWVKKATLKKYD